MKSSSGLTPPHTPFPYRSILSACNSVKQKSESDFQLPGKISPNFLHGVTTKFCKGGKISQNTTKTQHNYKNLLMLRQRK